MEDKRTKKEILDELEKVKGFYETERSEAYELRGQIKEKDKRITHLERKTNELKDRLLNASSKLHFYKGTVSAYQRILVSNDILKEPKMPDDIHRHMPNRHHDIDLSDVLGDI